MASGDASKVSLATMQSAVLTQLGAQAATYSASRTALYGLNADGSTNGNSVTNVDWNPTHDSSTFTILDTSRNHVMLAGNWRYADNTVGSGRVLGVVGQAPGLTARYAAFGGNPMGERGNAAMDALMKNTVAWLSSRSGASNFKVVTAHLPGSATYWFPYEARVRAWFATQFPAVTINGMTAAQASSGSAQDDTCDGDRLSACLQGADLLVIGRQQGPGGSPDNYPGAYDGAAVMQAVQRAQAAGIPVLYLHHYRDANDLATRLLDYFGLSISTNYWDQEGLKAYGAVDLPAVPAGNTELQAMLRKLDQGGFSTTWSGCVNDLGRIQCSGDTAFVNEFFTPASSQRSRLRSLDASGVALFGQSGYTLEKQLVLLGDKYRESVSYPMTKESSGQSFMRAYFSDMVAYVNRPTNQVARNLGNFSSGFSAATPTVSRVVSTSAQTVGTREYVTGLYVMPGRTVTVTRTDGSAASVTMGLNMLRDTTHVYNTYDRPTQLASPRVPLLNGKTVTMTSPFGGPLYLFVAAAAGNPAVTVQVDGVITYPVLRDMRDAAKVAAFQAELASTPTNWVTVTTDFLTLHSNLTNFRQTLSAHGGNLSLLADRIWTYMIKDTYELAGFNAADPAAFTLSSSVSNFCTNAGWDCTGITHRRDVMQHVISDNYSNCGAGCSGNPYDQNWALEPMGWGETHEIGHNLQRGRLKIYAGQSGEVSNNIFPSHKQMVFNRANPSATPLTRGVGGTRQAFDLLKAAAATADPFAHVYSNMWSDTAYAANNTLRLAFYRQLVEYARYYNPSFTDGWELYTLMYLLERNFSASSANWSTVKSGLGFGTYAAYPSSMNGNDFMVIAASRIIGKDMRPVFDLWGVSVSAEASVQVAALGYGAAGRLLFPMSHLNQYGSNIAAPVLISTSATYPSGY